MPVSDFRWLTREEIDEMNWAEMTDGREEGYILEVVFSHNVEIVM